MEDFASYAIGRRARLLKKQDREKLFDEADIEAMLSLENPRFARAFEEWNEYNRKILKFAIDSGVIRPKDMAKWDLYNYVPFYRVGTPAPKATPGVPPGKVKGWHILTGGSENVRPVIQNMLQNTAMWIDLGITNVARSKAIDLAMNHARGARWITKLHPDIKKQIVRIEPWEMERRFWDALGIDKEMVDPLVQDFVKEGFNSMGPNHRGWLMNQTPRENNIIARMVKGEPEYFKATDNVVFRSFLALNREREKSALVNTLDKIRRFEQATVTLTPDFIAANFARDTLAASVFSRYGFVPGIDSVRGLKSRVFHDENFKLWMANGGGFGGLQLEESGYTRHLERAYRKLGVDPRTVVTSYQDGLLFARLMADAFEAASRMGEFRKGMAREVDPRTGAYWASEVATDFRMRGDSARLAKVQDSAMFLRAGMNGLDRAFRGFTRDPHRGTIMAKSMMLAFTAQSLYMMNRGNPLYDLLEDWDKDGHFHLLPPSLYYLKNKNNMPSNAELVQIIKEHPDMPQRVAARKELERRYYHFRYPKPWEVGAIGTMAERWLEHTLDYLDAVKTGSQTIRDVGTDTARVFSTQFRLNPIPAAFSPLTELALNKDFFTWRPVESEAAQSRGVPFLEANTWTNPYIKEMFESAQFAPRTTQLISPAQAEHLLRGYLNTVGAYALMMLEESTPTHPDVPLRKRPVVRRFVGDKALYADKSKREFWALVNESSEYAESMRTMAKEQKATEAMRWGETPETIKTEAARKEYQGYRKARDEVVKTDSIDVVQAHATFIFPPHDVRALQADGTWYDLGALKKQTSDQFSRIINEFSKGATKQMEKIISERGTVQ
jgi:hypothetical protein